MAERKKNRKTEEAADIKQMIALEEELSTLKEQYGIPEKKKWWVRAGDMLAQRMERKPVKVNRKKYIRLALSCGWLCGSHRFYSGQKFLGVLYLLFCWTGIPVAMTLIDLMIVLPMQADESGMIAI